MSGSLHTHSSEMTLSHARMAQVKGIHFKRVYPHLFMSCSQPTFYERNDSEILRLRVQLFMVELDSCEDRLGLPEMEVLFITTAYCRPHNAKDFFGQLSTRPTDHPPHR